MSQFQSIHNSLRNDNDRPPIALSSLPNRSLQTEANFLGGNLRNTTADYAAFTASVDMTTNRLFSENKKLGICSII